MKLSNPLERKTKSPLTPGAETRLGKIDIRKTSPDRALEYVRRLEQNALYERKQRVAKYDPHYAGPPHEDILEIDRQLRAIRGVGVDLRFLAGGSQSRGSTVAELLEEYKKILDEDSKFETKLQEEGQPANNATVDHSARMVAILKGLEG